MLNSELLRGRAVRLACRAHNPEVIGSNPVLVTRSKPFCSLIISVESAALLESNKVGISNLTALNLLK